MEEWADGVYAEQEHFAHAIKQAASIGQCKLLKDISKLDMELFIGELDDEQGRNEPERLVPSRESGTSKAP